MVQIDWNRAPWGSGTDAHIARLLGCSSATVRYHRKKRGIEAVRIIPQGREVRRNYHREYARTRRRVKCRCGTPYTDTGTSRNGKRLRRCLTCHPPRAEKPRRQLLNLVGNRYGRLTVDSEAEPIYHKRGAKRRWLCRCDCGEITIACGQFLRDGRKRSCGCLLREYYESMKTIPLRARS